MDLFSIVLTAIGLAMDCFSVSIVNGLFLKQSKFFKALKMASFFGSFQAIMFSVGWLAIRSFSKVISEVDHWIAFGLLLFIGSKMIYESQKELESKAKPLNLSVLLLLSIATSIDSLGVGVSFALLQTSITVPVITIGLASFIFSIIGIFIGKKFGHVFENKIEIIGGIILIGIGVKILIEHLMII